MLVVPKIVINSRTIEPQFGGSGGTLIIEIHFGMERQKIFNREAEHRGVGFGARLDLWVDLAVLIGIGAVQLSLEEGPVQNSIGVEARQSAHYVVGAEEMVFLDID